MAFEILEARGGGACIVTPTGDRAERMLDVLEWNPLESGSRSHGLAVPRQCVVGGRHGTLSGMPTVKRTQRVRR